MKAKSASNRVTFLGSNYTLTLTRKPTTPIFDNVFSTTLSHSALSFIGRLQYQWYSSWRIAYGGTLYHTSPINSSPLKRYWKTSHFKLYWFILARVIILKLFFFQKSNSLFPMRAQWISPREMTRLTSKHGVNANFLIKLVSQVITGGSILDFNATVVWHSDLSRMLISSNGNQFNTFNRLKNICTALLRWLFVFIAHDP